LIPDERNRATVETSKADDERVIVGAATVPVQLDPVVEEPLDIVQRVRAVLMARELDRTPDLLVRPGFARAAVAASRAPRRRARLRAG
jgi:hypothetical protein